MVWAFLLFTFVINMKELLKIKNYIYSKAILSKVSENPPCLVGIHKGIRFKIYLKPTKAPRQKKAIIQIIVEKNGKNFYPKHTREIINILK